MTDVAVLLPVEALEPNPFQHRRDFPPESLLELAESIRDHGFLQPILARPKPRKSEGVTHQIVAGERRWRAAKALGLDSIPAVVRKMSDLEAGFNAVRENAQRENPDDWSTAVAMRNLMRQSAKAGKPMSERDMARELNMSLGYVRNHLGLFKLKTDVQEMVQRNASVKSAAFEINKVTDPQPRRELIEAVDAGAGFQDIKRQVDSWTANKKAKAQQFPDTTTRKAATKDSREASEAEKKVESALAEVEAQLMNAAAWLPRVSAAYRKAQAAERLKRIKERVAGM